MKKSNWLCGIAYVVAGIIFLLIGIFTDTKLDSLMFGFAGAGIIPGMVMIYKYFYWNSPNNVERYKEKLEAEGHIIIRKGRKNVRYYVKDYEKISLIYNRWILVFEAG